MVSKRPHGALRLISGAEILRSLSALPFPYLTQTTVTRHWGWDPKPNASTLWGGCQWNMTWQRLSTWSLPSCQWQKIGNTGNAGAVPDPTAKLSYFVSKISSHMRKPVLACSGIIKSCQRRSLRLPLSHRHGWIGKKWMPSISLTGGCRSRITIGHKCTAAWPICLTRILMRTTPWW